MNDKFATTCVHAGQVPDMQTGAVVPPIHLATTYAQESPGKHLGFEYSRTDNPTRHTLETVLGALEGGRHALAFASGLAAETTLLFTLKPGDHVVTVDDLYGGTHRLFSQVLADHGITTTAVDARDPEQISKAWTPATVLCWIESPTNPLLKIMDIAKIADVVHTHGGLCVVDNTFATPVLQQPLALGADVVVHSTTKYLGGHSDVVGGAIITNNDMLAEKLRFLQNAVGAVPSPFDCWLLMRGIKTLALRVEQQNASAAMISTWLTTAPGVARVLYPGLPFHDGHELVTSLWKGRGGAMISFELAPEADPDAFFRSLTVITCAESLGAVESLIELPAAMTHSGMPPAQRNALGISDHLVRLSVGIEDPEDLIEDLSQALQAALRTSTHTS
ncbi:MAG: trans-sulfuration enzyme family protein [Candidatus Dormibacteria bacterium]